VPARTDGLLASNGLRGRDDGYRTGLNPKSSSDPVLVQRIQSYTSSANQDARETGIASEAVSDIFLSYASEDRARIKPLVHALQQHGWTVWWDRTILAGKIWEEEIEAALEGSRCVIVAWSEASIKSHWVRAEAHEAMQRDVLVPVLLDRVKIPLAFRRFHAVNLLGWRGEMPSSEFEELARAVTSLLGSSGAGITPAGSGIEPRTGEVRINPGDNLGYVWIPPGKFIMGCSLGDSECYDDEKPAHEVSISRGFWIGQTPVTQAAYRAVVGNYLSRS